MAETLRGLLEVADVPPGKGPDSLEARTAAIASFDGLGPPDLCQLIKCSGRAGAAPTGGWGRTSSGSPIAAGVSQGTPKTEELRFFHFVLGLDVESAPLVAKYIRDVITAQERGAWGPTSLFKGPAHRICGGTYCCYNAFCRVDVRVEVRIPGLPGVLSFGVDAYGEKVELTREVWEGAQLSAFLRASQPPPRLPALRALPLFGQPATVATFVRLATKNFEWGERLVVASDFSAGTHALCELFSNFLVGSRRLKLALEVLPSLQSMYPAVAIHVARAYVKRGQPEAALNVLVRSAREAPDDAPVLNYQAKVLLRENKPGAVELAVVAAELAVKFLPGAWKFWVTLARAYLQARRFSECLAALNAPAFQTCEAEEMPSELGLPDLSKVDQAAAPKEALSASVTRRPVDYEAFQPAAAPFGGFGRSFGLHPGLDDTVKHGSSSSTAPAMSMGVSRDASGAPGPTAVVAAAEAERSVLASLVACHGAALSAIEQGAYAVLVALYRHLGWDQLVEERSKVFLMLDAGDTDREAEGAGHQGDEHGGANGSAASAAAGAGQRRIPRRLCSKFLDRLFQTLHDDLECFTEWCREQEGPWQPHGSGLLWMHRGALAERLQQDTQAELALRLCQARCTCPRASLQLLKVYAGCDRVVEAVAQLAVLCGIASGGARRLDPHPWAAVGGWPDWLFDAAARLVCKFGLSTAHAAAGRLPEACVPYRFALAELLRAVSDASVEGCDR